MILISNHEMIIFMPHTAPIYTLHFLKQLNKQTNKQKTESTQTRMSRAFRSFHPNQKRSGADRPESTGAE